MMRTRNKQSHYTSASFHAVRLGGFLASTIVSGILIWFCYQLKTDGYKLPWTFLIVLAASLLNLTTLLLTLAIYCCGTLSPLFNLILNIPILVIWLVGLCLLCWNMFGTLGHACTIANWASSEGIMICQIYKALFSFTIIGALSQLALIVLDVAARNRQTRLGGYDKMEEPRDVKLDAIPVINEPPEENRSYPLQQVQQHYRDETPGWRPGQTDHGAQRRTNAQESISMDHFMYQAPVQHTHYDSGDSFQGRNGRRS